MTTSMMKLRNRLRERIHEVCSSFSVMQVAIFAYVFAVLWWTAFPLVSLSTGELKPRGLYVDEHGLSVGTGSWSPRYKSTDSSTTTVGLKSLSTGGVQFPSEDSHSSLCEFITSEVTCQYISIPDWSVDAGGNSGNNNSTGGGGGGGGSSVGITQITVDHAWKAASLEVTVVVLAYHNSNLQHSLVTSIMRSLNHCLTLAY